MSSALLTRHFRLSEFSVSSRYPHLARSIRFSLKEIERIRFACAAILEPLRNHFGGPVMITSGKRTPELNQAVGGHPQSHHLFMADTGACDVVVADVAPGAAARWLQDHTQFAYIIVYPRSGFFHLSFPNARGLQNRIYSKQE